MESPDNREIGSVARRAVIEVDHPEVISPSPRVEEVVQQVDDVPTLLDGGNPIADIWLSGRPVDVNARAVAEAIALPAAGLPRASGQLVAIRATVARAIARLDPDVHTLLTGARLELLVDHHL
jgi:hypothetical protein